jgi:hypothetical protein
LSELKGFWTVTIAAEMRKAAIGSFSEDLFKIEQSFPDYPRADHAKAYYFLYFDQRPESAVIFNSGENIRRLDPYREAFSFQHRGRGRPIN